MKRKLFILLISILMLVSNLSFSGFSVRAEGTEEETPTQETLPETPGEQQPSVDEPEKEPLPESPVVSSDDVAITDDGKTKALQLQNEAAGDSQIAKSVLKENTSLSEKEIDEIVEDLFRADAKAGENDPDELPRVDDGCEIEWITVKWLTADTFDDGDSSLLTVAPSNNNVTDVRLQINYSISGDTDFKPGDIRITVPTYIIHKRNADGSDGTGIHSHIGS